MPEENVSIEGPGPCSPPECPCIDCGCSGNSDNPIRFFSGKILLREVDLDIGIQGFTHSRTFLNRNVTLSAWDSAQGWNWSIEEWPYIVRRVRTFPDDSTHESIVLKYGMYPLWFDRQEDGSFTCRYGAGAYNGLEYDESEHVYTYRRKSANGVLIIEFEDFEQSPSVAGMMRRLVDENNAQILALEYSDKRIVRLEHSQGYQLHYSFIESGDLEGKVSKVTMVKLVDTEESPLRAVRYVYYDGTTEEGSLGDLKAAITQAPLLGTTPLEWEDLEVKYYRYIGATHLLACVLGSANYNLLKRAGQDALFMGVDSHGQDLVPTYANNLYEYDSAQRVVREIARNGQTGTGEQGLIYERSYNPKITRRRRVPDSVQDYNTWAWKIVEEGRPGFSTIVYTNVVGAPMAKIRRTNGPSSESWIEYFRYDEKGRRILRAKPSAVIEVDEHLEDLVGKSDDGRYLGLRANEGYIETTTFYDSTTATSIDAGGVVGYPEYSFIQKGFEGTPIPQVLLKYVASDNASGPVIFAIAEEIRFKFEADDPEARITTKYNYTWRDAPSFGNPTVAEKTTIYPEIPVGEGGDGSSAVRKEYYDENRLLIWELDERGVITKNEYDPAKRVLTRRVRDCSAVDNPPGWPVLPGAHFDETTVYEFDSLLRVNSVRENAVECIVDGLAKQVSPATVTKYFESSLSAQGVGQELVFDAEIALRGFYDENGDFAAMNPISITLKDKEGNVWHRIESKKSLVPGSGTGDYIFRRSDWSRWSYFEFDKRGLNIVERVYHKIPLAAFDSGIEGVNFEVGAEGRNFFESARHYSEDTNLLSRKKGFDGTITRIVYDLIGRPKQTYVGLHDFAGWYPNADTGDLRLVDEVQYDQGFPGGTVGSFKARNSFDAAGNLIQSTAEGDGRLENWQAFDNLNRRTEIKRGTVIGSVGSPTTVILEERRMDYDMASNIVETVTMKLDTGSDIEDPSYRSSYVQNWFDPLRRVVAKADFGALASSPARGSTPPLSSDAILVDAVSYNERNEIQLSITPANIETSWRYDDKGRPVEIVFGNESGLGVRTERREYNGNDDITLVMLVEVGQTTHYVYGSTTESSDISLGGALSKKIYPDGSMEAYFYNRRGEISRFEDSNKTVHGYIRDGLGRVIHDCVQVFGPDIDRTVQRRSFAFDERGFLSSVMSCSDINLSHSFAINELRFNYDQFGGLKEYIQEHDGRVDGDSLRTTWERGIVGSANTNRVEKVIYPSGSRVRLSRGGQVNDFIDRVTLVTFGSEPSPAAVATYDYLGLDVTVRVAYVGPNVTLDLWGGNIGLYEGFDRFGNIVNHRWSGGVDLAWFEYGYSRDRQRLYRRDTLASFEDVALDEVYAYDKLNQVTKLDRGRLNEFRDGVEPGSQTFFEGFEYDGIGNCTKYQWGSGGILTTQGREFNAINQLVRFNPTPEEGNWPKPRYDGAGNTTRVSGVNERNRPFRVVYDAWNLAVKVYSFDPSWNRHRVTLNAFDGLGRKVRCQEYSDFDEVGPDSVIYVTDYFYDEKWRVLEEYRNAQLRYRFVWDYAKNGNPDALLMRQGPDGILPSDLLYPLLDAQFNTVALINQNADVVERYTYTAFGRPEYRNPDFEPRENSSHEWRILFAGYFQDRVTGLYYGRNRLFNPSLSRWTSRDPIGETGGINLYAFVENDPLNKADPFGLCSSGDPPMVGTIEAEALPVGIGVSNLTREDSDAIFSGLKMADAAASAGQMLIGGHRMVGAIQAGEKALPPPTGSDLGKMGADLGHDMNDAKKKGMDMGGVTQYSWIVTIPYDCCVCWLFFWWDWKAQTPVTQGSTQNFKDGDWAAAASILAATIAEARKKIKC